MDLAAPGQDITTLARPVVLNGKAVPAYQIADGTSFAAPMVAGAAALLRKAAPDAPITEIRKALLAGARRNPSLDGLVFYGSLDVACALSALSNRQRRAKADWDLVDLDERKYPDFANATKDCGGKTPLVEETPQPVDPGYLRAKGKTTLSALIEASKLSTAPTSPSLTWQEKLLGKQEAQRIAFDSAGKGVDPPNLKDSVYNAGRASVGCTEPGSAITRLAVVVLDKGAPQVWYFPTDRESRRDRIEVALALAAPLSAKLNSLTIRLRAYCDQFPSIG